jgi:hypothetical protein
MMTKDDALKMAIEALEEAREQIGGLPPLDKLIQNCKETLEQPAQEPVGYITNSGLSAVFNIGLDLDDGTPLYARSE